MDNDESDSLNSCFVSCVRVHAHVHVHVRARVHDRERSLERMKVVGRRNRDRGRDRSLGQIRGQNRGHIHEENARRAKERVPLDKRVQDRILERSKQLVEQLDHRGRWVVGVSGSDMEPELVLERLASRGSDTAVEQVQVRVQDVLPVSVLPVLPLPEQPRVPEMEPGPVYE